MKKIVFVILLLPLLALGQEVAPGDARAVRRVIEAQIEAFKHDDAERAFSYAAPGIRNTFSTPENFMEMVRRQYAVVYRPRSIAFDAPVFLADDELVQPVRMTDADGRAWLAIYPMLRGPDGAWRTNGCQLQRVGVET
jgi:hypothetical protein